MLVLEVFHQGSNGETAIVDQYLNCGFHVVELISGKLVSVGKADVIVPTKEMLRHPGRPFELWLPLSTQGELLVEITHQPASWLTAQGMARQKGVQSQMSQSKKQLHQLMTRKGKS